MEKVSKKELAFYLKALQDDYAYSESQFWRIHTKLRNGRDLNAWIKRYSKRKNNLP